jgi:2-dehydro-3-deoxy-D-arabinonate dehydratase
MPIDITQLPSTPSLLRVRQGTSTLTGLFEDGRLRRVERGFDELLSEPVVAIREALQQAGPWLDPDECELLAPAESQEVWAAGVTYLRSRQARMEESTEGDIYARVYRADRPELFFKAAGWRVVSPGGEVGIRPDSQWNVPEPELCVLSNRFAEVVAYSCGNDMSSRSIEGENPLYLPQAKVYDRSCSIGPVAVLAWQVTPAASRIEMRIERAGEVVFIGHAAVSGLVRDPAELSAVLHSAYPLPAGAWLMTGTAIVPPLPYTAESGDLVTITIEGLGTLVNRVAVVPHSGATAGPRLAGDDVKLT